MEEQPKNFLCYVLTFSNVTVIISYRSYNDSLEVSTCGFVFNHRLILSDLKDEADMISNSVVLS